MALAARREAQAPCAPPQAHKTQKRGVKAISVKKIIGPLAVYAAACIGYGRCTGDVLGYGLAWNMALALLPLVLQQAMRRCRPRAGRGALGLVWLLLLPNTFYMVTDLIHVPPQMAWVEALADGTVAVRHSALLREWALLLLLGVGAFFAALLGCRALAGLEECLPAAWPAPARQAAVAGVCLLCGIGIYLGRFLRFNSWDVLHPVQLARSVLGSASAFSALFVLMMALGIFGMYRFYRHMAR